MKRSVRSIGSVLGLIAVSFWVGCSEQSGPLSPKDDNRIEPLAKKVDVPGVEVKPVFRIPTGRKSERLTVFVFYEKGGNGGGGGKKPPKDDGGGEECSDANTNQAYSELGVGWPYSGISVEYQPTFEPESVIGLAFGAIDLAFNAWESAVNNESLVNFTKDSSAPLPPERDGRNIVGWRQLVGRDARKVLAATYIWDDGNGKISETDIVFNTAHKWAVNPSIKPGSTICGQDFDVQAIGTHEIGHLLGLGHVVDDGDSANGDETDATMAPTAAKGELKKQTLTQGDVDGAIKVTPPPLASS